MADLAGKKGVLVMDDNEQVKDVVDDEQLEDEVKDEPQEQTKDAPPAESPPAGDTVPVAVVAELRESRRFEREKNARLEQQVQDLQQGSRASAATEKSPVEKFIDEFGADAALDGRTMQAQRDWEKGQVALESQQRQQGEQIANRQAAEADARINLSTTNMGQGLDFDSLQTMGQHLLTEGDLLDIRNAGPDAAKVAYQRLEDRILRSPLAPTLKTLQKTRSSTKPKPKPKEGDKPAPDQQETGEPEDVGMRTSTKQLSDFIFS